MTNDLYPVELQVENLYCFRGKHTLQLEPTVYAVLAQAEDNPARSNWLGKSTLLTAFAFALFGWHTKRADEDIITAGENKCRVQLRLSDGTVIERTKQRGKSMQLKVADAGGSLVTQARGQEHIDRLVGVSKDDFFYVFFFEQKQIGALVTARSAERVSIVEGWLAVELEPVQRLHAAAVRHYGQTTEALKKLQEEERTIRDDAKQLMTELCGPEHEGISFDLTIKALIKAATKEKEAKLKELAAAREEAAAAKVMRGKVQKLEEFEAVVAQGTALREQFDALPADADATAAATGARLGEASAAADKARAHLKRLQASDYTFDGQCPVACQACPAASWVAEQATSPAALAAAREAAREATTAQQEANAAHTTATRVASQRQALDRQLVALRARAEQLYDEAEEARVFSAAAEGDADALVSQLEAEVEAISLKLAQHQSDHEWGMQASARLQELLRTLIPQAAAEHRLAAEAVEITGRTGAQQSIQELVMARIETRANDMLSNAGIPLQVAVSWEQETKGLAKVCGQCGTAFPASQRVKQCGACGAARGQNTTRKLSIEPSNRSGAAEDLAGVALGIAASQWLRSQRGARWATVFIDEPFGALDQHNRQALGSHIATLLRSTYASAFVVAHERAILSAMPGRINIVAGPNGSRVQGAST